MEIALDTLGLPQLLNPSPDPLGVMIVDIERFTLERPANPGSGRVGIDPQAEMLEILRNSERSLNREVGRNEILALTASLGELAKMMRGVQGRKQVVFLSEGFDSSFMLGVTGDSDAARQRIQQLNEAAMSGEYWEVKSDERFGSTATQNQLDAMLQDFIRADCTIQSVDIGGLRAGVDVKTRSSGQEGLFTMAKSTGGEFYRNYNNLSEAMGEMLERTSVSYVLAIQPQMLRADGQFHRLKVKLKGNAGRGARLVQAQGERRTRRPPGASSGLLRPQAVHRSGRRRASAGGRRPHHGRR
jgi:VWFA-related protein